MNCASRENSLSQAYKQNSLSQGYKQNSPFQGCQKIGKDNSQQHSTATTTQHSYRIPEEQVTIRT